MMQILAGTPPTPVETWDYEWDYSKGLLTANGWTKNGNGTETLESDGVKLTSAANNYVRCRKSDYEATTVVMLIECDVPSTNTGKQNLRLCVSNGTNGLHVYPTDGYWRLYDASFAANGTTLAALTSGTHTLRLQLNNGVCAVWIDDVLCGDNIQASTMTGSNQTIIMSQNQNGYSLIKNVKLKKGRI